MNSHTNHRVRELLAALPEYVQQQADGANARFHQNPSHPGLRFKQIDPGPPPIYSARVGIGYRAVGALRGDTIVWFWIGSHADYDQLLRQL